MHQMENFCEQGEDCHCAISVIRAEQASCSSFFALELPQSQIAADANPLVFIMGY
jgi:hypothetical protein